MARVGLRLLATKAVGDVYGGDAVAEDAEDVPEAGRVGPSRDEARDLAARRDQVPAADPGFDALRDVRCHAVIVLKPRAGGTWEPGSSPRAALPQRELPLR